MPFCTQCGNQVADADAFCSKCGKVQGAPGAASYQAPRYAGSDALDRLTPRTASILCYVPTIGWIAAVVVLAAQKFKGDVTTRFHAFQGLYLFAVWLMVQWVVRPIMATTSHNGMRVDKMLEGVIVLVALFMLVKTSQGEAYVLPIIGELAQRSAAEQ